MARCGRCGLWNKYPEAHHEKKYTGVCMWYQIRLPDEEVFAERECKDFFEQIPGLHPFDHFKYKIQRDNLGDAYTTANRAKVISYISITLSILGMGLAVYKTFWGS